VVESRFKEEAMGVGIYKKKAMPSVIAGAIWLLLMVVPAKAQDVASGWKKCPPCPPPVEKAPLDLMPEQPPAMAPPPEEPLLGPERAGAFGGETVALAAPNMIGDFLAPSCTLRTVTYFVQTPPTVVNGTPGTPSTPGTPGFGFISETGQVVVTQPPTPGTPATPGTPGFVIPGSTRAVTATFFVPSESHSFKIADNESARPQDRLIGNFNFFNFVEGQSNARMGANVGTVNFYRETVGFEKTFFDGYASVGMRLPFDLLDVGGAVNLQSADAGDLAIIFKAILLQNRQSQYLISGGLAVITPTGPVALGGNGFAVDVFNTTQLEPFLGFLWAPGNFFLQGFFSIDVPTDLNDVTFMFNDWGVGYFLFRDRPSAFITALAPTFEVHVNDPLTHRHASADCTVGLPDWVDLTGGFTVEFNRRATLAVGLSAPVTGPKPYALEAITQLNIRF
jgi:hypothetical protein